MTVKSATRIKVLNVREGVLEEVEKVARTDEEWKQLLTPDQYRVTRLKGTEQAYSGENYDTKDEGLYKCSCCGNDLFESKAKYDSGTGWPSFFEPVSEHNIMTQYDDGLLMMRTEVLCARCEAHLGHVFNDGPAPTYKRYCLNSAALSLQKK